MFRLITRLLLVLGVLGAVLFTAVLPAQAHAVLVGTSPTAGYNTAGPVQQVRLAFSEAVSAGANAVRITGPQPGSGGTAQLTDGGHTLTLATGALRDGVYEVQWQVTADDGDLVEGSYSFAVGTGAVLLEAARTGGSPASDLLTAALRWVLFIGLAVSLGGLAGQVFTWRLRQLAAGVGAQPLPAVPALPVAIGALVGALAALALTIHALDPSSWLTGATKLLSWSALSQRSAGLPALELGLLLTAAVSAKLPGKARALVAAPLLGVALTEGWRSHLHEQAGLGGVLVIAVHLALAAAWTGALVVVLRAAALWRAAGRTNAAWQLVGLYSRSALVAYLAVTITGTLAAVLLIPTLASLLQTGYGQALLVKLALVTMVTGLALHARRRLRRDQADFAVTRTHRMQPRVMTAVLASTAVLLSINPPRLSAAAQQELPPPAPTGPVQAFGALAGQLTVGVTVSAGQLRVQVSNPSSDDQGKAKDQTFTATARLGRPGEPTRRTVLRPCGLGCFVAPTQLAAPGLRVELDVASPGWTGGQVALDVPWPPVPAGAELRRALALLRAAPEVTIDEQVSSDTSRPAPIAVTVRDSGPRFLSTEPYGDPGALQPFTLPPAGGLRRLAFGVGGTYFVEFTLDAAGHLTAERLVTPNHLIQRRLHYPR